MDDKAIAKKLATLNTLPEGYEPNLQSKWELLEGSMNRGKNSTKRIVYVWMSIAASFFIVLLLGTEHYFTKSNNVLVEQKALPRPNPPVIRSQLTQSEKIQPLVVSSVHVSDKRMTKVTNQPLPTATPVVEKNQESTQEEDSLIRPILEPVKTTLSAQLDPLKKVRQRYVQVDFGEPVKQTVETQEQMASAVDLHVRIFNGEESNTADNNYSSDLSQEPFKIKINH